MIARYLVFMLAVIGLIAVNAYFATPVLWSLLSGFVVGFIGTRWVQRANAA